MLCWCQRVGSIRTLHKNRQLRILILCFSSKYKDSRQTIIFLGSCKHPNNRGAPQLPLFKTRQLHLPRSAVPKFQKCQHVSKVRLQYIRSGHIKVIIREGLENLQWYSSVKGARGYPEYANFLKCLVRGGTPPRPYPLKRLAQKLCFWGEKHSLWGFPIRCCSLSGEGDTPTSTIVNNKCLLGGGWVTPLRLPQS